VINSIILFSIILLPLVSLSQLTDKDKGILRQELSDRINILRVSKGLKPLLFNDTLQKTAEFHSKYMAKNDILGHDEKPAKYATPKKRVLAFEGNEFELVGENVLYSTPQNLPIKKKDIIALADEMFNSWKNSPKHYANMTEPEYIFGDLGFETNLDRRIVYATQVFGTKGHVVRNQISKNSFGLIQAAEDCEKEYEGYSNLIMNLGNNLRIEGNEVMLYYHDISYFNKMFSGPTDGIAIDLISKEQLLCGQANQLDFSPVYDGIILKPYFSIEMLQNNSAESDYRVITKVGDIPQNLEGNEYSPSLILLKNGKACKYIYPAEIPKKDYDLRPFEPIVNDEPTVELVREGVIQSQTINYNFNTNRTESVDLPKIVEQTGMIHSIRINSFSSVEGDSTHNAQLHNSRASFMMKHVSSILNASSELFTINAEENWDQMNFQLNYFEHDELARLSHDSLKKILANRDKTLPWDSLLFAQRKSLVIINYLGEYTDLDNFESIGEFNLRTAVAMEDASLANKALYEMYHSSDYNPEILFEPQIIEFIKMHPKTVGNYSALLSIDFYRDPYLITSFIHTWLNRIDRLDGNARSNILHLYTLVGTHLLDNWDVSSERLSNVIHPIKIEGFSSEREKSELVLNLHLTFIQYYSQVNDAPNISKSFYYIAKYFKNNSLKKEDDVDLALFFNNWSMYKMAVEHLSLRFESDSLNEDGLFILAQTMNFTNYNDDSGVYLEVHKKALHSNQERWCDWVNDDFQVMRNHQIKRLHCESCK
jgi:uncharacterized protein YkwD